MFWLIFAEARRNAENAEKNHAAPSASSATSALLTKSFLVHLKGRKGHKGPSSDVLVNFRGGREGRGKKLRSDLRVLRDLCVTN